MAGLKYLDNTLSEQTCGHQTTVKKGCVFWVVGRMSTLVWRMRLPIMVLNIKRVQWLEHHMIVVVAWWPTGYIGAVVADWAKVCAMVLDIKRPQ